MKLIEKNWPMAGTPESVLESQYVADCRDPGILAKRKDLNRYLCSTKMWRPSSVIFEHDRLSMKIDGAGLS